MPVERVNIDTDFHAAKEAAIAEALSGMDEGDVLIVCRGDWKCCPDGGGDPCEFCAHIPYAPGLTARQVLDMVRPQ